MRVIPEPCFIDLNSKSNEFFCFHHPYSVPAPDSTLDAVLASPTASISRSLAPVSVIVIPGPSFRVLNSRSTPFFA